jgi:mannosyltransferase
VNVLVATAPSGSAPAPTRDRARLGDPVVVAVLAAAVSLAGAARPSLWYDEAATISAAADRSLPDMMRMLGNIDAVHGLYYLIMRGWYAIFPVTEFWSRAPSGLAVAAAAAGVVVLAKQFCRRSVAVCAGVAFAVLPRITWAGMEARSYAMVTMAAVWLTVLVVVAARRSRPSLWLLYALMLVLSILLNVCLVLMVLVHAVVVPSLASRRGTVTRWAATSLATVVVTAPFLVFASGQMRRQVFWISPLRSGTIHDVLATQYFDHSNVCAIVAGSIIAVSVLIWLFSPTRLDAGERRLLVVAVTWMAVPTGVFLLYSALFEPLYYPRYLCFTAPAMALVLGVCIAAVGRAPLGAAGLLTLLAIAALPNYLFTQRGPYAKEGMDYSQVADLITEHATPGDCLVMDNTITWKPGPIRAMTAARPSAFSKLVDPGRGPSAASVARLWDGHIAIWAVAPRINRCAMLWIVSERDAHLPSHESGQNLAPGAHFGGAPAYLVTHQLGFRLVERWQFNFAQVMKATR